MRISVGKSPDAPPEESRHITISPDLQKRRKRKVLERAKKKKRERARNREKRRQGEESRVHRRLQGNESSPRKDDRSRKRHLETPGRLHTLGNRHRPLSPCESRSAGGIFFFSEQSTTADSAPTRTTEFPNSLARTTRVRGRRAVCLNARARAREIHARHARDTRTLATIAGSALARGGARTFSSWRYRAASRRPSGFSLSRPPSRPPPRARARSFIPFSPPRERRWGDVRPGAPRALPREYPDTLLSSAMPARDGKPPAHVLSIKRTRDNIRG